MGHIVWVTLSGSHCEGHIVCVTLCGSHYLFVKWIIFANYDKMLKCETSYVKTVTSTVMLMPVALAKNSRTSSFLCVLHFEIVRFKTTLSWRKIWVFAPKVKVIRGVTF